MDENESKVTAAPGAQSPEKAKSPRQLLLDQISRLDAWNREAANSWLCSKDTAEQVRRNTETIRDCLVFLEMFPQSTEE